MKKSICGVECGGCSMNDGCNGCENTNGNPFGGGCVVADTCRENRLNMLKEQLIKEFNALGIPDMEEVTDLNYLKGGFVNLEYTMPGGQKIKFWDDNKIYLGNQLHKKDSERCYGITADENYLLVCEYGCYGADPEIIVFKKR